MEAMSEARSSAKSAESQGAGDGERQLDEIADKLYALRPDEFAAARDEHVRTARAAGRQPLARELSRLRKPTQSAWLINLLRRDQPEVLDQFVQLGGELSRAQAEASGPALHRLTAQRRELEAALVRRARALAAKAGVTVSDAAEREAQETLSAALARPEVADEVRSGRLVKPAAYAGFGTPVSAAAPTPTRQPAEDAESKRPTPLHRPQKDEVAERAAQRARERREQAQRAVDDARAALGTAAQALADQRGAADAANQVELEARQHEQEGRQREQEARAQLEQLQRQLRDLEAGVASAERAAQEAARQRDQADKAHTAAQQALELAANQFLAIAQP
jgi:hypothetical protein